jgi:hypothetical protein
MGGELLRFRLGKWQAPHQFTRRSNVIVAAFYMCRTGGTAASLQASGIFARVSARMLAGRDRAVSGQAPEPESCELRPPVPVPDFASPGSPRLRSAAEFGERVFCRDVGVLKARRSFA